ncbi:MAG: zf-HC2 domain-containing protein [Deltaproteobacteria bacterium]|nr:zf-HC2 domain-containing protein [Deltaproteobacteria bacterium]
MIGPRLTCREVVEFLWRYEENELSPEEREAFDAHLADCPCCGTYLATYRETVALEHEAFSDLEAWVPETVPEELVLGILAARRANG